MAERCREPEQGRPVARQPRQTDRRRLGSLLLRRRRQHLRHQTFRRGNYFVTFEEVLI